MEVPCTPPTLEALAPATEACSSSELSKAAAVYCCAEDAWDEEKDALGLVEAALESWRPWDDESSATCPELHAQGAFAGDQQRADTTQAPSCKSAATESASASSHALTAGAASGFEFLAPDSAAPVLLRTEAAHLCGVYLSSAMEARSFPVPHPRAVCQRAVALLDALATRQPAVDVSDLSFDDVHALAALAQLLESEALFNAVVPRFVQLLVAGDRETRAACSKVLAEDFEAGQRRRLEKSLERLQAPDRV